ncbi:uncharacterized protein LOC143298322 [Babylonia areolata]|uniref:uncharacterized protein LOC143298322 n=1 Tax=Babylonia areolata TaxID=304850 RepID=UPI003FCF05E0
MKNKDGQVNGPNTNDKEGQVNGPNTNSEEKEASGVTLPRCPAARFSNDVHRTEAAGWGRAGHTLQEKHGPGGRPSGNNSEHPTRARPQHATPEAMTGDCTPRADRKPDRGAEGKGSRTPDPAELQGAPTHSCDSELCGEEHVINVDPAQEEGTDSGTTTRGVMVNGGRTDEYPAPSRRPGTTTDATRYLQDAHYKLIFVSLIMKSRNRLPVDKIKVAENVLEPLPRKTATIGKGLGTEMHPDLFIPKDEEMKEAFLKETESNSKELSKRQFGSGTGGNGVTNEEVVLSECCGTSRLRPGFQQWVVSMLRAPAPPHSADVARQRAHFSSEWNRLASFQDCQVPPGVYLIPIASSGFFLADSPDPARPNAERRVECAFCGVRVPILRFKGERADEVHRRVSPTCRFVSGARVDQVTISESHPRPEGQTPEGRASSPELSGYSEATEQQHVTGAATSALSVSVSTAATTSDASAPLSVSVSTAATNSDASAPLPVSVSAAATNSDASAPAPATSSGATASATATTTTLSTNTTTGDVSTPAEDQRSQSARGTADTGSSTADTRQVSSAPGGASSADTVADASPDGQRTGNRDTAELSGNTPGEGEERRESGGGDGSEGEASSTENLEAERQIVTYEDLGIFSQRPKRPDMAVKQVRINTFGSWQHQATHPAARMAEAGFYYTGHADLVRCFYCKGGLKTWERSDQPWVEHCRWFPRCPYVRLCKGQMFVDVVQNMNRSGYSPTICEQEVVEEVQKKEADEPYTLEPPSPVDTYRKELARDGLPAEEDISDDCLTAVFERLELENDAIQNETLCKMCQSKEVSVLFLPCGHLVACAECAPALRSCAICRQSVSGSVRVRMDNVSGDPPDAPPVEGAEAGEATTMPGGP